MKKKIKSIWSTRINKKTSSLFQKVGSSIEVDKRLFKEDIDGSIAHVEMLCKQKIISFKIKNKIIWGLKKIENEIKKKKFIFRTEYEDIHMNIEKRLYDIIGEDAGFMHSARSRNDQVLTDLKLWMKKSTIELIEVLKNLNKHFVNLAEKNVYTIMPGFTHLKNAQPISLGHYLLAYVEMFDRDLNRFNYNLNNLNESPLGVGALSGTSFNIDRKFTAKKLKFKKISNNSIDTVSDRDFALDFLFSCATCSMHISRLSEEFIIWNSDAFNFISLKDSLVTGSSMMPQKKNPDPLEYLRGKSGNAYGNLFSMFTILKGLPLSYFKDLQDDKNLIFKSFDDLKNSILILSEIIKNINFNKKKMLQLASIGYITSTDLAEHIVQKLKIPFRKSYEITAKIVNYAEKNNKTLDQISIKEIKKIEKKLDSDVLKILNLENSVKSKKSYGGTSFENVNRMIKKYKKGINVK